MKREYSGVPLVGVGAVVVHRKTDTTSNYVLLVKRGQPPGKGLWAIPGGLVKYGESLVEAVERELEEETGIKARAQGIVWVDEVIIYNNNGIKYHYVIVDFLMKPLDNLINPRPSSDVEDAKWFEISTTNINNIKVTITTRRLLKYLLDKDFKPSLLPITREKASIEYRGSKC